MTIKKYVAALAITALSVAAAASQAIAATPEVDPAGGKFPISATASSGASSFSVEGSSLKVSCTAGTGSGQITSKTTGEGSYLLSGCGENLFGSKCTSAGQASGSIKLETSVSHLVYLDENHTKPGVLATPPASGVFAKFTCGGGLVSIEVKGNGVLGAITSPACGSTSKSSTVVAETVSTGVQKYRQIEETGTFYDMTVSQNGGAFQTAGTTWTVTGTAAENMTLTCPEQK
jgi:hypothetical protein